MRMMMKVAIPVEAGNDGIKTGTLPRTILAFVERFKPQSAWFTTENGSRTGFFVFDLKDPAEMVPAAEPFFMNLHARIDWAPVMDFEDLKKGMERLPKS